MNNPLVEAFNYLFGIEDYDTLHFHMKSGKVVTVYVTEYKIQYDGNEVVGVSLKWAKRMNRRGVPKLIVASMDLSAIEFITRE